VRVVRARHSWDGAVMGWSGRGSMMAILFLDDGGWKYARPWVRSITKE
jgi:hypothetical protein